MQDGIPTRSKLVFFPFFYCSIKTVYYSGTTTSPKYTHKLLCPCATEHIALYVKMNKHQLGVSHRQEGLFYRLYFITVCHLHRGMLIASCDYLHIWKSTSICYVPPVSHESAPPTPSHNCCLFTRWQAAPKARQHLHLTSCRLTYVKFTQTQA